MTIQKNLLSLFILIFAGCSPLPQPVGGSCEYETIIGIAHLQRKNGALFASFSAKSFMSDAFRTAQFELDKEMVLSAKRQHPAKLRRITSGSCTPYSLTLLGPYSGYGEAYGDREGIFIELDPDGNISETARAKLQQISTTYTTLEDDALTLQLCGQTGHAGTDEYNLNLGARHTTLVAGLLQEDGVLAAQMTTTSRGEYGCGQACLPTHDNANGVCVSFR